jgi:hypothetical protein
MLQVLTIVLAIAFSNVPPPTIPGGTQESSVTTTSAG